MLSRRDPFREMLSLQRSLNRLMDSSFTENGEPSTPSWGLALDVLEGEDNYVVKASIPGINPDDLEITFNNDTLTIRGQVSDESETEQGQYHLRERRYGSFVRSVTLPTSIKTDDIRADYENGVLKLTLPKTEEVKPRRIEVRRGGQQQQTIEAKAK